MGIMVDKVALGKVFCEYFSVSCQLTDVEDSTYYSYSTVSCVSLPAYNSFCMDKVENTVSDSTSFAACVSVA
jgi:hypothetical protein